MQGLEEAKENLTKGLLLRCEFVYESGTFDRWPLSLRMDGNSVESVWIYGTYAPGVKIPDFERLNHLWFGLKGSYLNPIE